MKCPNCNELVADNMAFCPNCGTKIEKVKAEEETVVSEEIVVSEEVAVSEEVKAAIEPEALDDKRLVCPRCSAEYDKEDVFCPNCGYNLAASEPVVMEEKETEKATNIESNVEPKKVSKKAAKEAKKAAKKASSKKRGASKIIGIILAAAVFVVAIVIIAAIVLNHFGAKKGGVGELIYYKDNAAIQMIGSKQVEIEGKVFKDKDDAYDIGYAIKYTEDGKKLLFPQKYENGTYSLYVKNANSKKDSGIKIDSEISRYALAGSNKVVYEKGSYEKSALYISDFEGNSEKIADNPYSYWVSENGKKVLYTKLNNDVYDLYAADLSLKDSPEKIASKIDRICAVSDDLKLLYYIKNGSLYECVDLKDSEKIESDVENVYTKKYEDLISIYIVVNNEKEKTIPYNNLFKDTDVIPDYETDEIIRDQLTDYYERELYYYSKSSGSILLAQGDVSYVIGPDEAFMYSVLFGTADEKLSIKELKGMSYDEKLNAIDLFRSQNSAFRINVNGFDYTLNCSFDDFYWNEGCTVNYDKDSNTAYLSFISTEGKDVLAKTVLSGDCTLNVLSEDYDGQVGISNGNVFYLANANEDGDELIVNGKAADSEVLYAHKSMDEQSIIYMKDCEDGVGTVMLWKDGKISKVADDVYDVCSSETGDIAVLTDYDIEELEGDLKLYHNGELKKLDTGVGFVMWFK